MPNARFPTGFVIGAATAAYQIEGATTADGRGESIWDRFCHTPGHVANGDTGDVACDHYHRFRQDVATLAEIGLTGYRFSTSWPRIMPGGTGPANPAGLDFYDRLVDELLGRAIAPQLTLYHWDLPQVLEDRGGWPARATADAFAEYAGVVAARLGDRVPQIATLNEPYIVSDHGYRQGLHAPGRREPDAALAAAHNLLVAHGLAVAAIRAGAPGVQVGVVLNLDPKQPASPHILDQEAASIVHDQHNRWFLDPLFGRDYPPDGARAWGWRRQEVRDGDMELIAAPLDFLGVNYYSRQVVRSPLLPPLPAPQVERTGMGWEVYPRGLTDVLQFVASRSGPLPLYVTENGAAYPANAASPERDPERLGYFQRHLAAVLAAIEAGVPVAGYFAWSLLDNFEWAYGYDQRFGIVHVDYETLERRVRDSARFLGRVARDGLPGPADGAAEASTVSAGGLEDRS